MAGRKSNEQLKACFKKFDKNGDGSLSIQELKALLKSGNCNAPDSVIADLFVYFDGPNGDKRITFEEFEKGLRAIDETRKKVKELFKQLDVDNSGYLDIKELSNLLDSCGHKFTKEEKEAILKDVDTSGDGKISQDEFIDHVM